MSLVGEAEACADGVADHRQRNPGTEEEAVACHQTAAVVDGEEGAPELFDCAAIFAKTRAGGQIEHPDADDGEEDHARDPDVACNFVALSAGDEKAADHGYEEGEHRGEELGIRRVRVGTVEPHDTDDDVEEDESKEGVGEEPERLAAEFADGFVLRDGLIGVHAAYSEVIANRR